MTLIVEFIDTSVLVEILRIPGKSQCHEATVAQLNERATAGTRFILPTATIIETGKHVFQLKDGGARRACAERFVQLLRLTARGSAPGRFTAVPGPRNFSISCAPAAPRNWIS